MTRSVCVHLLPALLLPEQLAGGAAVIIDVLRASTTMITALSHGASCVFPCESIDQALQLRHSSDTGTVLLGGERGGIRIDGFDLGNSPAEYRPDVVAGRILGFTTTNGTRALLQSLRARQIIIGAFVNLSEVVAFLRLHGLPVHLVCAGTDGFITGEDVLFAGAVLDLLTSVPPPNPTSPIRDPDPSREWSLNDAAVMAHSYWLQQVKCSEHRESECRIFGPDFSAQLAAVLCSTRGGRNLMELGCVSDIELCSRIDSVPVVPIYCAEKMSLTAVSQQAGGNRVRPES